MELKGKTALVTGGAVRLGAAVARRLAEHGVDCVIHYRNSEKEARALVHELEQEGVQACSFKADLCDDEACRRLMQQAYAAHGRLDILINNAAVFEKHGWDELSMETLDSQLKPNLYAPVLLSKYFAESTEQGVIIQYLDRRVTSLDTSCIPYMLSKASLALFTELAALELAPRIRVNAVAPGAVLPPPGESEAYFNDIKGSIPLEQTSPPEAICDAVQYLLEQDSLTGQTIYVDGGQHLIKQEQL